MIIGPVDLQTVEYRTWLSIVFRRRRRQVNRRRQTKQSKTGRQAGARAKLKNPSMFRVHFTVPTK